MEKEQCKMEKKRYLKPAVISHEPIVFETAISCAPPEFPGAISECHYVGPLSNF